MYTPPFYKNENIEEVAAFIEANSFGILISQTDTKLWGTHIPLELDVNDEGKKILFGHISKGNLQWKNFVNDNEVMAIFNGPHTYISSSWYDHENVPTWNYIAVHVYGKIKIIEGAKVVNALKKLVDKYEKKSAKPVSVETMSSDFLNKHINGIIAFEIEITEIQSAYKLSQNRDEKNHKNITSELRSSGDLNAIAVANEMEKHKR